MRHREEIIKMECLATFDTTHMALFFEKACRAEGLSVKIVPVPVSYTHLRYDKHSEDHVPAS